MKLYIVEVGSYEESYTHFVTENLERANEVFEEVILNMGFMRWADILEADTNTKYSYAWTSGEEGSWADMCIVRSYRVKV